MNATLNTQTLTQRLTGRVRDFFLAPATPLPLAVFRIGVAAVLLLQALSLAGSVQELFGRNAIVQWAAIYQAGGGGMGFHPGVPGVNVLAYYLAPYGVTPAQCVQGVFLLYVASLSCLLIGWRTRISAVVAWITHLSLCASGFMTIYGVDQFANIALFYLLWMPVGGALSLDRSAGRTSGEPGVTNRISLRVLQLHLCIAYVASGVHKASGEQWWNGEAIWRAVTLPELAQFDMTWLAMVPWLAMLLCWGTLLLEVGYPLILIPRLRKPMAFGIISLHVGIATSMGLISFSALMGALTFSAFVIGGEPAPAGIAERVVQQQRAAMEQETETYPILV